MNTSDHIVFVIDDDRSVCKSLGRLLRTAGHPTETFVSLTDFMSREYYSGAGSGARKRNRSPASVDLSG